MYQEQYFVSVLNFVFTFQLYRHMLRLTSGQWSASVDDALPVLYKSDHFIVVDKRFDLKVNSNDPEDTVTVATLLSRQFPSIVDTTALFGFRWATTKVSDIF